MPIFLLALLGGLGQIAASLVGRVLVALSIGYVTYKGLDILLTLFQDKVFGYLLSSGYGEINAALNMLNIGKCVNVTFSAIVARNALDGLSAAGFTKAKIK